MDQGKRLKEQAEGHIQEQDTNKIGGAIQLGKPTFQERRLKLFEEFYARQAEALKNKPRENISITLKDGKPLQGVKYETTPLQIARDISKGLAEKVVAAKVVYTQQLESDFIDADQDEAAHKTNKNYLIWDLHRPLEGDCQLELLTFEDNDGKEVFWHSSAHVLGSALEQVFGCHLCIGPALESGFFYDSYIGDYRISQTDYDKIIKAAQELVKAKQEFQRIELTKQEALELFAENPFKQQLISKKIPDNAKTTAYKCGKLIDLCTGPHLPNTSLIKAFTITKNSAAYWLGKNTNDNLQRVYGISFPSTKQLEEYLKIQKELEQRDHRNVGKAQQLFLSHPLSPGSAFFYPHGAHIYNTLMNFMRKQYQVRGYQEVISPNIFNVKLWKTSGHWDKYKENLFIINLGDEGEYGLKPMNCPGHCLMFDMVQHSFRDLPIRFADFGVLHRNEIHGALSGLTRVRRFQQDDAHIFCRMDQIQQEIYAALDFLSYIYKLFGFEFKLYLSTRPEKFLGTLEMWNEAEKQLELSLKAFGKLYEVNPGDGAFYGPKIDVKLFDAYKREHQCGTIQLDFNLPERFNLQYRASEDTSEVQLDKQVSHQEMEEKAKEILEAGQSKQSLKKQKNKKNDQAQKQPDQVIESGQYIKDEKEKQEKQEQLEKQEQQGQAEKQEQQQEQQEQQPKQEQIQVEGSVVSSEKQFEHGSSDTASKTSLSENQVKKILHEQKYDPGYHHIKAGFVRPVIIHRAILGSLERLIGVLTEQCAGKWPFWLSPRQMVITPITKYYNDVAENLASRLRLEGYQVFCDTSDKTLNNKVRNAQISYYNFVGVVGEQEAKSGTIDVRDCEKNQSIGKLTLPQLIKFFKTQEPEKSEVEQKIFVASDEQIKLNDELSEKTFLDGDGFKVGPRDHEVYKGIKNVDPALSNLLRWYRYMSHHHKDELQQE